MVLPVSKKRQMFNSVTKNNRWFRCHELLYYNTQNYTIHTMLLLILETDVTDFAVVSSLCTVNRMIGNSVKLKFEVSGKTFRKLESTEHCVVLLCSVLLLYISLSIHFYPITWLTFFFIYSHIHSFERHNWLTVTYAFLLLCRKIF